MRYSIIVLPTVFFLFLSVLAGAQPHSLVFQGRPVAGKSPVKKVVFDPDYSRVISERVIAEIESLRMFAAGGKSVFFESRPRGIQESRFGWCSLADGGETSRSLAIDGGAAFSAEMVVYARNAVISSQGDRMVFVLYKSAGPWADYDSVVALYDFRTADLRILTPHGAWCERPIFSPDGQQIAFYRAPMEIFTEVGSGSSNDAHGHVLCVVQADGGEVRALSPPPNTLFPFLRNPPSWSPDGRRILFEAQYNDPSIKPPDFGDPISEMLPSGIYCYDLDTDKMERMTPAERGQGAMAPSWAPDGRHFGCILRGELVILDSQTKAITKTGMEARQCCKWSPQGGVIAYMDKENFLSVFSLDNKKSFQIAGIRILDDFFWVH